MNWFERINKTEDLSGLISELKSIQNVEEVRIDNKNNIFIFSSIHSGDLLSIDNSNLSEISRMSNEEMEIEGFNKIAVNFTKNINKISTNHNIIIKSKNNKLLFWGKPINSISELQKIQKEAMFSSDDDIIGWFNLKDKVKDLIPYLKKA